MKETVVMHELVSSNILYSKKYLKSMHISYFYNLIVVFIGCCVSVYFYHWLFGLLVKHRFLIHILTDFFA